jgi:ATP-dependent DNA helicase RecG
MVRAKSAFKSVNRSINKQKLESLGLVVPYAGRKTVSNGCLILFGKEMHRSRFFPDARVSCARFRGTDKSQFIDRIDIEGSILDAVEVVPKFIKLNTRLFSRIESFKREDIPAYPEVAVREVLVNALVHSDYSLTGMRILVSIFSNRMEIQNPGMLPFGITLEDFKAGVSKVRKRVIARIFRELGLMEEWGSGYKRVLNACSKGGYPEPEWTELGVAVRVIFYPHHEAIESETTDVPVNVPVNVRVNDRQKWFLNQTGKGIRVSSSELAAHWDISQKTAQRDIADLKQKGLIEFSGAPKNGSYRLKS